MNEIQPLYRVPGHNDSVMVQQSSTPALSSETSLQLKPEKPEHLPPLRTPSQREGSEKTPSGPVPDDANSTEESSPRKSTVGTHAYLQNDLDKAIEEAQATKDLVSVGKCDPTDYALTIL